MTPWSYRTSWFPAQMVDKLRYECRSSKRIIYYCLILCTDDGGEACYLTRLESSFVPYIEASGLNRCFLENL